MKGKRQSTKKGAATESPAPKEKSIKKKGERFKHITGQSKKSKKTIKFVGLVEKAKEFVERAGPHGVRNEKGKKKEKKEETPQDQRKKGKNAGAR